MILVRTINKSSRQAANNKKEHHMKRNVIVLSLLSTVLLAGSAFAAGQNQGDINISARMRLGLSFANEVDMDFTPSAGHIDFYGTPDPTVDFVTMGTDGAVAAVGTILQPSAAVGTPGSIDIVSDGVSLVNITCTATAVLAEAGAKTMNVDQLQISMNTGTAFASPGYVCAGLASGSPLSYQLTGTDKIILGGRLVGPADVITALYSSTLTGGTPATVEVVYQ